MHRTLVDAATLHAHLGDPDWAVIDCRFALGAPARGRAAYVEGHIPGAVYAHLDDDLSAPVVLGRTGRHPLPAVLDFTATVSAWGIDAQTQVVAYDDAGGAFAARLWWMLRWLGHDAAAVLDGGLAAWIAAGGPLEPGTAARAPRTFVPRPRPERVATAHDVQALRTAPDARVLDARTADRFSGATEPIDPVAGHIPGARNVPWPEHLDADGRFLPPTALRARYAPLLGGTAPERTVVYCGSGVTAAHGALALAHAGLGDVRLYAGSWSEWITDPDRPVARDADA